MHQCVGPYSKEKCAKFGNEGVVAQNPYMRYYGWFDGSLSQGVVVDLPGTRHLERSARHD